MSEGSRADQGASLEAAAGADNASHSTQLVRLPTSPSSSISSLTSEEEAFDHKAPLVSPDLPPTLGVRDLLRLRKKDKKDRRERKLLAERRPSAPVQLFEPEEDKEENEADREGTLPFTRDVIITGWNMVGGRTWTEKAKVGAYVGEPRQSQRARRYHRG